MAIATIAAVFLVACGGERDGEAQAGDDGPRVVATTGIAADIARQVAGDGAEVEQLVPDGANPHSFEPSARDRRALGDADLVVGFGEGLEEALPLGDLDTPVFLISDHVGELRAFEVGEGDDDHGHEDDDHGHEDDDHGHEQGSTDPHVWMDPTLTAAALPALAEALAGADPVGAGSYEQRADAYARRLEALDAEIAELVSGIPEERRKLVTSHEAVGYFADRYGLEFIGAPFGLTPEAEASARRLAELIEEIRRHDVPAVFAQRGDDPSVLRQVAREADVEVVDDLLIESLGDEGATYEDALRHTARMIAEGLGAG